MATARERFRVAREDEEQSLLQCSSQGSSLSRPAAAAGARAARRTTLSAKHATTTASCGDHLRQLRLGLQLRQREELPGSGRPRGESGVGSRGLRRLDGCVPDRGERVAGAGGRGAVRHQGRLPDVRHCVLGLPPHDPELRLQARIEDPAHGGAACAALEGGEVVRHAQAPASRAAPQRLGASRTARAFTPRGCARGPDRAAARAGARLQA